MQWSSQSAGVRQFRVMQHTRRSMVVSFTAMLVAIASLANGFTIRKTEPFAETTDLETGGSSLNNVIALNESKTVPNTDKFTTYSYIDLETSTSQSTNVNVTKKYVDAGNTNMLQSTNIASTTITPTLAVTPEISKIRDLNISTTNSVNLTEKSLNQSDLVTPEITTELSPSRHNSTSQTLRSIELSTISIKYTNDKDNSSDSGQKNTTQKVINSTTVLPDIYELISSKLKLATTDEPGQESVVEATSDGPMPDTTTKTYTNVNSAQSATLIEESFNVTSTDVTTDANDEYLENNPPTTVVIPTVQNVNTETLPEVPVTLTLQTDKIIDRQVPNTTATEDTTTSAQSMTKSGSARISLEKVMTNTPIPSLMALKNDLINVQDYTTRKDDNKTLNVTTPPTSEYPTTQNKSELVNSLTEKIEVFSSKRAGYIDNTETTSVRLEEATTEKIDNISNNNDTETFASVYETEGTDSENSDALEVKNVTGIESQSQLVEDAIKEELMMEKILNENEYMKEKAHQLETSKQILNITPVVDITPTMLEAVTEDVLSVKPINIEKKQSIALYAVSPNYKPPKKLDIQPTKQFVRDPDDNSWRNERISSLGIVFKPKNASKSFTEVLKNKTTELSNFAYKNDKNEIPDLRIRLEKIAEVRKSKKKKVNAFGDVVYSDSDEHPVDNTNVSNEEATSPMSPQEKTNMLSGTTSPSLSSTSDTEILNYIHQKESFKMFQEEFATPPTTFRNKLYRLGELYDSADDYDADYVTKIDLKKTTTPKSITFRPRPQNYISNTNTLVPATYMPDRQPTVQYFPPTKKVKSSIKPQLNEQVNINEYDDFFKNKVNQFTFTHSPKTDYDASYSTAAVAQSDQFQNSGKETTKPDSTQAYNNDRINKNVYLTSQPQVTDAHGGFLNNGNANKASYVIKHYKDFIADAAKINDDENLPYTVAPIQGLTISDVDKYSAPNDVKKGEDYDYNTQFRKDIVNRFVDNFNQNSDRFKLDFPVIYNNSVVHRTIDDNGRVIASSRQSMKRLYDTASPTTNFLTNVKPCDANCESMRVVDLSPAYELHYYVPEQEEKEEIEPRQNVLPYRIRL